MTNHQHADRARTARIRDLNDAFRTTLEGGAVLITGRIIDRGLNFQREVLARVRGFAAFEPGNDPYDEHDFGSVAVGKRKVFFKIDYYDLDLQYGSSNRADPSVTTRVLTIMLAEEY